MSQEQTTTSAADNIFEELDQELRRLKSAVSHLRLSESAATQAIEAAEQVVKKQDQLSRQLADYVSRFSQPQADKTTALVAELAQAVATQQQALEQALGRLAGDDARPLSQETEKRQEKVEKLLAQVEAQLAAGVAHHLSQELETLLQQTVQEISTAQQYGRTLGQLQQHTQAIREQQLRAATQLDTLTAGRQGQSRQLEELQGGVKTVAQQVTEYHRQVEQLLPLLKQHAPVPPAPDQELRRKVEELQGMVKSVGQRLTEQAAQQRRLPTEWQSQLQQLLQPLMGPKAPLPITPDHALRRKVEELQQTVVSQQGLLKRQQTLGLVTLLAALAGLVVAFLRG